MARLSKPRKDVKTRAATVPRVMLQPRESRRRNGAERDIEVLAKPLRIFVSHSTKYRDLAKALASALKSLQFQEPLEVLLCEEMQGGAEWLSWINRELRSADILLLLYPHESMDMSWCSYEKGRFDRDERGRRAVLCIKNVDIARPPPVFEQYQAYDADVAGIRKFFTELFAKGVFTDGKAITPDVDRVSSEYCKRAATAASELAQHFANARVRDLLFERRIAISIPSDDEHGSPLDAATVDGNEGALGLFDMASQNNIGWRMLRERLTGKMAWLVDLENALPSIRSGSLPPPLSPFRANDGKIYLPVIPRTEIVAQKLRKIVVIFVVADSDNLRRMLDWLPPAAMPDNWIGLVRLVKLMVRARWEVLEPQFQEARYRLPDAQRCAELAESAVVGMERLSCEARNQGFNGLARFRAIFDTSLLPDIDRASDQYQAALQELKSGAPANAAELADRLNGMLANNTTWMQIAAKQFSLLTTQLSSTIPEPYRTTS